MAQQWAAGQDSDICTSHMLAWAGCVAGYLWVLVRVLYTVPPLMQCHSGISMKQTAVADPVSQERGIQPTCLQT